MTRTAKLLLWGAAVTTGAAAIGAATAMLFGQQADERHRRTYLALTRAFYTLPGYAAPEVPDGAGSQRPELVLLPGGQGS